MPRGGPRRSKDTASGLRRTAVAKDAARGGGRGWITAIGAVRVLKARNVSPSLQVGTLYFTVGPTFSVSSTETGSSIRANRLRGRTICLTDLQAW